MQHLAETEQMKQLMVVKFGATMWELDPMSILCSIPGTIMTPELSQEGTSTAILWLLHFWNKGAGMEPAWSGMVLWTPEAHFEGRIISSQGFHDVVMEYREFDCLVLYVSWVN